jgi:hypothetical protein
MTKSVREGLTVCKVEAYSHAVSGVAYIVGRVQLAEPGKGDDARYARLESLPGRISRSASQVGRPSLR